MSTSYTLTALPFRKSPSSIHQEGKVLAEKGDDRKTISQILKHAADRDILAPTVSEFFSNVELLHRTLL